MEEPKSPDTIRGGDTSLFSLPSGSATATTPHTSNVSVTTTITSAFSPEKPNVIQNKKLRQTLETVIMLFEKLAKCCKILVAETFAGSSNAVMAAEEMTRIYLQIHTISISNLESLVDSFELDILAQSHVQQPRTENREISLKLPRGISSHLSHTLDQHPSKSQMFSGSANYTETRNDEEAKHPKVLQNQDLCNAQAAARESETTVQSMVNQELGDEKRDAPPANLVTSPSARTVTRKKERRARLWRRRLMPKRRTAE